MARIWLSRGKLDGLEIHYTSAGQGPVTLLIHGLGGFAESWRETGAALASHGRVIALDLPGFGQSAKPRRAYTLDFFARAVEGLLRALAIERVRLVGHSLGGGVAAAFALAHPERVDRLALISATIPGFPIRLSLVYRLMVLPGIGELFSSLVTPGICAVALRRCLVEPCPDDVAFLVEHQYSTRTTPDGRAAYLATLRAMKSEFTREGAAWREAFAEWRRPTLVIHGRQDPVVPIRHAVAVAEGIPHAEVRWLDGCGHLPQLEHAAVVNEFLSAFLFAPAGR
jgi:4,5:9,10-diseco-3-hydroxy-5,9,17-trioxoandrosta-1(10),2-diene-4-oate hydrolase